MLGLNSIEYLQTVEGLEALYGDAAPASLRKVVDRITPKYWQWISASRFCVLTTVGPAGTDGSPRGDDGPPVIALDEYTLAMPDWPCNNRLDNLRNIVEDGRVSLLFLIGGENFAVRVNGIARLDPSWFGASVVLRGIPDFSHIPPSSRLKNDAGTTLTIDMQNRPCHLPIAEIKVDHSNEA
jgi:hypothetical protein